MRSLEPLYSAIHINLDLILLYKANLPMNEYATLLFNSAHLSGLIECGEEYLRWCKTPWRGNGGRRESGECSGSPASVCWPQQRQCGNRRPVGALAANMLGLDQRDAHLAK